AILRTGERFGTEHLVQILLGADTEAIRRFGHDRLPTFGVGKERDANGWRSIFRQIYAAGLIQIDIVQHGRWLVTDRGRRVLRGEERIEIRRDVLAPGGRARAKSPPATLAQPEDQSLLAALKALRAELARAQAVPAY